MEGLTEEERREAERMARVAEEAERRAALRASVHASTNVAPVQSKSARVDSAAVQLVSRPVYVSKNAREKATVAPQNSNVHDTSASQPQREYDNGRANSGGDNRRYEREEEDDEGRRGARGYGQHHERDRRRSRSRSRSRGRMEYYDDRDRGDRGDGRDRAPGGYHQRGDRDGREGREGSYQRGGDWGRGERDGYDRYRGRSRSRSRERDGGYRDHDRPGRGPPAPPHASSYANDRYARPGPGPGQQQGGGGYRGGPAYSALPVPPAKPAAPAPPPSSLTAAEREEVRKRYLGGSALPGTTHTAAAPAAPAAGAGREQKRVGNASKMFKFDWDASEDTAARAGPGLGVGPGLGGIERLVSGLGEGGGGYRPGTRGGGSGALDPFEARRAAKAAGVANGTIQSAAASRSEGGLLLRSADVYGSVSRHEQAAYEEEEAEDEDEEEDEHMQAGEEAAEAWEESKGGKGGAGKASAGVTGGGGKGQAAAEAILPPTHWSNKPLASMTDRDWRIMREDFDIHVKGGRAVFPLRSWDEAALHPHLRQAVDAAGYKQPTPIQRQAVPMGLAGKDLIGIAETGSGKTAAFLLPLLTYVLNQPPSAREAVSEAGPLALVMAPTRELAQQIEEECAKLARIAGVRSVSIVGGSSIEEQSGKLRAGVDVVIGTPGRLIDMLGQSYLALSQCKYIVLDEADRMIDLGFEPQVTAVMDAMVGGSNEGMAEMVTVTGLSQQGAGGGGGGQGGGPVVNQAVQGRTTHMFTATMPPSVERLAKRYMTTPATVRIGDEDTGKNRRITQTVIFLPSEQRKKQALLEQLRTLPRPLIIFLNAKRACDVLAGELDKAGAAAPAVLHSGKTQDGREAALAEFKAGQADVLVATDVAARGLDIPDVAAVLNYDMAADIDRYTHRIGRTGRAGKTGLAITFLTEGDAAMLPALKGYMDSTGQKVPEELSRRAQAAERAAGDGERPGGGGHGHGGGGGGHGRGGGRGGGGHRG